MKLFLTISVLLASLAATAQVDPDYFLQKATENYQNQNYQQAIDYAQRTLNLDTAQEKAYYVLSASYLQQKQWVMALESARLGLKYFPNATGFHWLLAEGALQSKQYQLAATHYEQVKTHFSGQKELAGGINIKKLNLRLGECYTQLANVAMKQGNNKESLQYFKRANQLLDRHAFSYVNLAIAYAKVEQWDRSLEVAESGLNRFPNSESLIKAKASALYYKKDFEGVEKSYGKLYEKNPNDLDIATAYGELLMANQQFQKASEVYNTLLKKYPKKQKIYESLMASYEARLNYEGKINILRQMLAHFDSTVVYQRIATTYEEIEQWDKAGKYYDTLLSLKPDDAFAIEQKLANAYVQQDSLEQALAIYRGLHMQQPKNAVVLENLAKVYQGTKSWKQALSSYQLLETLEKSEKVYARLGYVSNEIGNETEALKYYEKSLLVGKSPEAMLGIAKLIRTSDQDRSLQLAESAFSMAFERLSQYENKLNNKLDGNAIGGLISNKALLQEIKVQEQLATSAFYYLASFDFDLVNEQLASLTADFPKSARVYFLVGDYFNSHQQKERAFTLLQHSARLNPNFKDTQLLLGAIYGNKKQYYQGILAYERALTLDPGDDEVYGHLIRLYRAYGKLDLLCDKWMVKYETSENEEILKPHLVEALHKAGRVEMAQKIIEEI